MAKRAKGFLHNLHFVLLPILVQHEQLALFDGVFDGPSGKVRLCGCLRATCATAARKSKSGRHPREREFSTCAKFILTRCEPLAQVIAFTPGWAAVGELGVADAQSRPALQHW